MTDDPKRPPYRVRNFPTARLFLNGTRVEQALAIEREAREVFLALEESDQALAMEVWDTIHACETMLAMLEIAGVDVGMARSDVVMKNIDRGYYQEAPRG